MNKYRYQLIIGLFLTTFLFASAMSATVANSISGSNAVAKIPDSTSITRPTAQVNKIHGCTGNTVIGATVQGPAVPCGLALGDLANDACAQVAPGFVAVGFGSTTQQQTVTPPPEFTSCPSQYLAPLDLGGFPGVDSSIPGKRLWMSASCVGQTNSNATGQLYQESCDDFGCGSASVVGTYPCNYNPMSQGPLCIWNNNPPPIVGQTQNICYVQCAPLQPPTCAWQ